RGRLDSATETIELALAERETANALALKAEILLETGNISTALTTVDKAVRKSSRYSRGWLLKGQIHLAKDESDKAKAALQRFLELKPTGKDADEVRGLLEVMP
ncbi:MAG: tetratricopeptide repeat protein, partial [Myxococcota bacterium]